MKNFLFILTHPRYWLMNYGYSEALDDWILKQLEGGMHFDKYDGYHVTLKNKRFWISNKPYGFHEELLRVRPSRLTIKKFYDRLEETYLKCEQS